MVDEYKDLDSNVICTLQVQRMVDEYKDLDSNVLCTLQVQRMVDEYKDCYLYIAGSENGG